VSGVLGLPLSAAEILGRFARGPNQGDRSGVPCRRPGEDALFDLTIGNDQYRLLVMIHNGNSAADSLSRCVVQSARPTCEAAPRGKVTARSSLKEGAPSGGDAALITRCRAGDPTAFEVLVEGYQPSVFAFAWSVTKNQEDARDVVQEVFLSVFSNLEGFDCGRSFKNWLFVMARNKCLDVVRKRMTDRKSLLAIWRAQMPAVGAGSPRPVRLEESALFASLLGRLRPKERVALCLRMNEGFTGPEIGAVLGCRESTARFYIFKALHRLRDLWCGTIEDACSAKQTLFS
jgi:RNA polymerase sigma-70 factor (ECF subfamily)